MNDFCPLHCYVAHWKGLQFVLVINIKLSSPASSPNNDFLSRFKASIGYSINMHPKDNLGKHLRASDVRTPNKYCIGQLKAQIEVPQEASEHALYVSLDIENNQALTVIPKSPGNAQEERLALYIGHMPANNPLTLHYLSMPLMKNIILTH